MVGVYDGRVRCLATLVLVVACAACGDEEPACSIACGDGCPGDLACSAGFCAAPSETCVPAFATVRAGSGFACALDQHGRLWCWGDNANREILGSSSAREPLASRFYRRAYPVAWGQHAVERTRQLFAQALAVYWLSAGAMSSDAFHTGGVWSLAMIGSSGTCTCQAGAT